MILFWSFHGSTACICTCCHNYASLLLLVLYSNTGSWIWILFCYSITCSNFNIHRGITRTNGAFLCLGGRSHEAYGNRAVCHYAEGGANEVYGNRAVCHYASVGGATRHTVVRSFVCLFVCLSVSHYAEGGATRHTVIVLSVSHSVCYIISAAHAKR